MPIARGYVARHSRGLSPDQEVLDLKRLHESQLAAQAHQVQAARLAQKRADTVANTPHFLTIGQAIGQVEGQDGWVSLTTEVQSAVAEGRLDDHQARELLGRLARVAVRQGWHGGTSSDTTYAGPVLEATVARLVDDLLAEAGSR